MQKLGFIFFGALVVMSLSFGSLGAQTAPEKITLGTITLSLNNLPIYVAQDKGFFAKENLFVEAVVLNASTRAIPGADRRLDADFRLFRHDHHQSRREGCQS